MISGVVCRCHNAKVFLNIGRGRIFPFVRQVSNDYMLVSLFAYFLKLLLTLSYKRNKMAFCGRNIGVFGALAIVSKTIQPRILNNNLFIVIILCCPPWPCVFFLLR